MSGLLLVGRLVLLAVHSISGWSMFCPLTSPTDGVVYVTNSPASFLVTSTLSACGLECFKRDRSACQYFNYNDATQLCGIFNAEPNDTSVATESTAKTYQVISHKQQTAKGNVVVASANNTSCNCCFCHGATLVSSPEKGF